MDKHTEAKIKKIREAMWHERLIFFPLKLIAAFLLYYYLEHGLFLIVAYVLFIIGELAARQYVNAEEANITFQNLHNSYAEGNAENLRAIEGLRVEITSGE